MIPADPANSVDDRLDFLLRQFWEVDACTAPIVQATKEELDCKAHFVMHHVRLESGAYSVRLPIKHSVELLGESYAQALRRFHSLERKLDRHPNLRTQYFIKKYLDLGHMSLVPQELRGKCQYFLPHHCVLKEESSTTKLRVVFDGSAATTSGYSLYDVLMSGPVIQPKLFHRLLRFRSHLVALTGDICKMYRCVRVFPDNSFLQCILWRDSIHDDVKVFKLDTVTYGTKPASFLSVRSMHQLAKDEGAGFPVGSRVVLQDFYVDDFISGAPTKTEALEIIAQTSSLLNKGQFQLRKWCSNIPEVLEGVPESDRESYLKFDDGSPFTKTLGLAWDPSADLLLFSFEALQPTSKPTRRSILSSVARFYDPMGLYRMVIDFKRLNAVTIFDTYPIPDINSTLDSLGRRSKYFTTIDLTSGFHQIHMNEKDIPKTAFSTLNGKNNFLRLPFGLKNAPAIFQRMIDDVLREHIGKICYVYIDDIIVFGEDYQSHWNNLRAVFQNLRKAKLHVNLEKTRFLSTQVEFLGYIVTQDGIKANA
ncbi:hypothetical protein KR067_007890 [Drosophila pandora]|nr:hypothetical protein KR067_007890 [Drosophila pandora]